MQLEAYLASSDHFERTVSMVVAEKGVDEIAAKLPAVVDEGSTVVGMAC